MFLVQLRARNFDIGTWEGGKVWGEGGHVNVQDFLTLLQTVNW